MSVGGEATAGEDEPLRSIRLDVDRRWRDESDYGGTQLCMDQDVTLTGLRVGSFSWSPPELSDDVVGRLLLVFLPLVPCSRAVLPAAFPAELVASELVAGGEGKPPAPTAARKDDERSAPLAAREIVLSCAFSVSPAIAAVYAALELPTKMAEGGREGVLPPELLLAPGLVKEEDADRRYVARGDKGDPTGGEVAGDDMMEMRMFVWLRVSGCNGPAS